MTHASNPFDALMDITARPQTVFVRGDGAYLWDDSGKRYLDFMQGWAVNCLGHSPPEILEALTAYGFSQFINRSDIEVQAGIFMKRQAAQLRKRG